MTTPNAPGLLATNCTSEGTKSEFDWRLKLSETWHAMSQVLGLRRLQEFMQVRAKLVLISRLSCRASAQGNMHCVVHYAGQ